MTLALPHSHPPRPSLNRLGRPTSPWIALSLQRPPSTNGVPSVALLRPSSLYTGTPLVHPPALIPLRAPQFSPLPRMAFFYVPMSHGNCVLNFPFPCFCPTDPFLGSTRDSAAFSFPRLHGPANPFPAFLRVRSNLTQSCRDCIDSIWRFFSPSFRNHPLPFSNLFPFSWKQGIPFLSDSFFP